MGLKIVKKWVGWSVGGSVGGSKVGKKKGDKRGIIPENRQKKRIKSKIEGGIIP